ncbi:MAG: cytidine deaminase [bacterium]
MGASNAELAQLALTARRGAHAPYSGVTVGAALEADGEIFTGANVENASYGLTVCAERVAVFAAVTHGARKFTRIAIASNQERCLQPCGACLQVLSEFCADLQIVLVDAAGNTTETSLKQLFPAPFKLSDS